MSLNSSAAQEALAAYKAAIANGSAVVQKDVSGQAGFGVSHGLYQYSLEAPAKLLFPQTTLLLEKTPRSAASPMSRVVEWKAITAKGSGWGSIAEAGTGTNLTTSEADKSATMKTIGAYNYVTEEARLYGQSFEDVLALSALTTLMTVKEMEEDILIGGNATALGAFTSTIVATDVATGGTMLPNTTYSYKVCALTLQAYRAYQAGTFTGDGATVTGSTAACANVNVTTANDGNSTHSVTLTWDEKAGACAYAIFQGVSAANYKLVTVTTSNAYTATLPAASLGANVTVPSNDGTANSNDFDGLIRQLVAGGQATITSLDNASLASDSAGGVGAITTACASQFDSYGIGPDYIVCNGAMAKRLTELIAGSTAPYLRLTADGGDAKFNGGIKVDTLLNPFTGEGMQIIAHRRMPANMILGLRLRNPFGYSNLGTSFDLAVAQDYRQVVYPMTLTDGRKIPQGVYVNECLRLYSGMGSFILSNVKTT